MASKSTPQAERLKGELEKRGIVVEAEKWDGHKHIDLVVARSQLNIEVDGKQHYENWRQILSDVHRAHHSDRKGWDTIHVPNSVVDRESDLLRVADALAVVARIRAHDRGHRMHYRHYALKLQE